MIHSFIKTHLSPPIGVMQKRFCNATRGLIIMLLRVHIVLSQQEKLTFMLLWGCDTIMLAFICKTKLYSSRNVTSVPPAEPLGMDLPVSTSQQLFPRTLTY